ncbi:MAG: Arc family DNA binding domain-containing protein [Planctomycetota bacterium]|nr:Arc family DNA binding domain-containing protein [Planctomycetota bacterium]
MARTSFLFRTDPKTLDAIRRWADDEFRSVNGQLEYVLRKALRDAGRLPSDDEPQNDDSNPTDTLEA